MSSARRSARLPSGRTNLSALPDRALASAGGAAIAGLTKSTGSLPPMGSSRAPPPTGRLRATIDPAAVPEREEGSLASSREFMSHHSRSQLLETRKQERQHHPLADQGVVAGRATGVKFWTVLKHPPEAIQLMDASFRACKRDIKDPGLEYVYNPKFSTRSALLAARRRDMLPPDVYDFNGDGVVDNMELFLGSRLDLNRDGKFTVSEEALQEIISQCTFGLEAAGANTNTSGNIEAREAMLQHSEGGADEAAERLAEAVRPPFAVSARRKFHDSAREGCTAIGVAYRVKDYPTFNATTTRPMTALDSVRQMHHTSTPSSSRPSARVDSGMSQWMSTQ